MPSEPFEKKGKCGAPVTGKVWKQGHSIKCPRRGSTAMRYWQPSRDRYRWPEHWGSHIDAEITDFCHYCRLKEKPYEEAEG